MRETRNRRARTSARHLQAPLRRNADVIRVRGENYADHWQRLKQKYVALRGVDEPASARTRKRVPATTIADVHAVARFFTDAAMAAIDKLPEPSRIAVAAGAAGTADARARVAAAITAWTRAVRRMREQSAGKASNERYPDNATFWQTDTRELALWLSTVGAVPSDWELIAESTAEAAKEAAEAVAEGAKDAARYAGELAVAPLKGAAEGLGIDSRTLLIGAGLVTAALVLPPLLRRGRS